uniref:Uncharacterized protein n=1 Tax=Opuntia streptacantha TaxID=393608 RepID=A0A7C9CJ69_OPUST
MIMIMMIRNQECGLTGYRLIGTSVGTLIIILTLLPPNMMCIIQTPKGKGSTPRRRFFTTFLLVQRTGGRFPAKPGRGKSLSSKKTIKMQKKRKWQWKMMCLKRLLGPKN